MFPPIVVQTLSILNIALQFAPVATGIYEKARDLFQTWFAGGLITAAQQAELMNWANNHQAATLAGQRPPELIVDADT